MKILRVLCLFCFSTLIYSLTFSQTKQGEFPVRLGPAGVNCTQAVKCSEEEYRNANCAPPTNKCFILNGTPTCVASNYQPEGNCSLYLPAPYLYPSPPQAGVQSLVYVAIGHDETARMQGALIKEARLHYRYQLFDISLNAYETGDCGGLCIDGWRGCGGWACVVNLAKMYDCPDWTGENCTLRDIDTVTPGDQFAPELPDLITNPRKPYMYVGIIPPMKAMTKIQYFVTVKDNADKPYEENFGGNWDNDGSPPSTGYFTNAGSNITRELQKMVAEGGQFGIYDWNVVIEDPPDNRPEGIRCTDYEGTHAGDIHHPYPDWGNTTDEGLKYDFLAAGYSSKDADGKLTFNWECNMPGNIPVIYEEDECGRKKPGYCKRVQVNRYLCNPKPNGEGKIEPCNDTAAAGCHRGGGCHSGRNAGPNWNDLVNNRSMSCNFAPCEYYRPCENDISCIWIRQLPTGCTGYCLVNPNDNCCKETISCNSVPQCYNYCKSEFAKGHSCKGFLPDHAPWEGVHHPGVTSNSPWYSKTDLDFERVDMAFDNSSVGRTFYRLKTYGLPDQFGQEMPEGRLTACDLLKLLHGMLHGETIFLNIWIFRIINPDAGDGWVLYIPAAANLMQSIDDIAGTAFGDLLIGGCDFEEGEVQSDCKDEADCIAKCTAECIPSCVLRSFITGGNPATCFATCPIQCAVTCNLHNFLSNAAQHILTCHMGDITGLLDGLSGLAGGGGGEECPGGPPVMSLLDAFTNSRTHLVADVMDLISLLMPSKGAQQTPDEQAERIGQTFAPVGMPTLDPATRTLSFSLERTGNTPEAKAWQRTIGPNPSMYYRVTASNMVIGLKKDPPFLTTFAGGVDTTNYGLIFRKPPKWISISMDTNAPNLEATKIDFKVTGVTAPPNASVTLQWKTPLFDDNPASPTYAKMIYSDGTTVKNADGSEIAGHPDDNFSRTYSGLKLDFNPATTISGGNIMGGFNIYRRYYDPTTKRWSPWRLLNEDSNGNKQYMFNRCQDPSLDANWTSVAYTPGNPEIDATYRDVDSRPQRYKREVRDVINKNLVDAGGQVTLWYYVDTNGDKKRNPLLTNPDGSPKEPWRNDKFATVSLLGDTFTFVDRATGTNANNPLWCDPVYDLCPNYTYAYKLVPVDKPNLFSRYRNSAYDGATCTGQEQNNLCDGGNEFRKVGTFKDPLCPQNMNADPKDDLKYPYPLQQHQMYDPPYNEGLGLVAYAAIPEDQNAPMPPLTRRLDACPKCDVNGDGKRNMKDLNTLNADFGARCNVVPPDCTQANRCTTGCNEKWDNCIKDANGYCKADLNCDCKVDLRDYGLLLYDIGEQR